jgi:hypothetical protein
VKGFGCRPVNEPAGAGGAAREVARWAVAVVIS